MENNTNKNSKIKTVEGIINDYDAAYAALKAPYNQLLQQLNNNPNYTAQGKLENMRKIEAEFKAKAETFRKETVAHFDEWLAIYGRDAKAEAIKHAKNERSVLGDALYADFLRRDVERATDPSQILGMFNNAPDEFAKMVIGRSALSFLQPQQDDLEVFSIFEEIKNGMYGDAGEIREKNVRVYEAAKDYAESTYNPDTEDNLRQRVGMPPANRLAVGF